MLRVAFTEQIGDGFIGERLNHALNESTWHTRMQPGERCSTDRRGSPPNRSVIIVIGSAVVNRDHPERGRASSPRTRGRSRGMFTESSAVVKCAAWLAEEWGRSGVMPSRTAVGLTRFPRLPILAP